jgi:hypothetical protein
VRVSAPPTCLPWASSPSSSVTRSRRRRSLGRRDPHVRVPATSSGASPRSPASPACAPPAARPPALPPSRPPRLRLPRHLGAIVFLEHTPISTPAATFAPSRRCDCEGISTRRLLPSVSTPVSSCVVPPLRLRGMLDSVCVSVCGPAPLMGYRPIRVRVESLYICTPSPINTTVHQFYI